MDILQSPRSCAVQQSAKRASARLTFLMVLSAVVLGGWVSACDSDESANTADTTTSPDTATSPDTSDTSDTTNAPDSSDTTNAPDTADTSDTHEDPELPPLPPPDDSLTDTSLAGVGVLWDAPLVMCNQWREGAPLADELQNKVRVTLWPAPRGLSRNQMEASLLAAVHVERSPLAAGQGHVGAMDADTSLQSYEVTEPQAGATSLTAILVHDLGELGRIEENFYLWHQDQGTPAPDINYNDPDSYWGNFAWFPPGSNEGVLLGDCDGPDNLETAVRVLVASNDQRQIAIKQYFRTIDTFAGSYPVHFVRSEVWFSDEPWRATYTDTFWAQTYSAQHHNWFENTAIDFTRSLQGFFKYFHPTNPFFPDGTNDQHQALASVLLKELDAWDVTPSIDVTWRDLDTQQDTTESFSFTPDPANPGHVRGIRIDRPFLQRNFADACGGTPPNVFAVGYHPSIFQVVACGDGQQASDWRAVVVAAFEQDFSLIGTTIDTLTPGGEHPNGVTFPLGPYTAELSFDAPSEYFRILINHPTNGLVLDTLTPPGTLDPELSFPEHIQAQSEAGKPPVSMTLSRQWIDQGIGKSSIFAPLSFSLTFGNKTYTASAWDALAYTNTHHNWQDTLSATTPDGHKLFWRYDFPVLDQREPSHLVRAESPDGSEILPETRLLIPRP